MRYLIILILLFPLMPFLDGQGERVPINPGDFNEDLVVDIFDLVIVGANFGLTSADPGFDDRADSNDDGKVDIADLAGFSILFGTTYTESTSTKYFIAIHNEPYHMDNGIQIIDRHYREALQPMVQRANEYNIKLTLMFSPNWADYISESPQRMAELQSWAEQGHEISAHHHSIYHQGRWDGYSNYSESEIIALRNSLGFTIEPYLGTLSDFTNKIKQINPDIKSGCMNDEEDKNVLPDEIIYDTCSGFANFGEPGTVMVDRLPQKGINEYISVADFKGIRRMWLAHTNITTEQQQQAAQNSMNSIDDGVFGVGTHSNPDQVQAYYDFLEFLNSKDPNGENSKTVTEIIEQRIIPGNEIPAELINSGLPIDTITEDPVYFTINVHIEPGVGSYCNDQSFYNNGKTILKNLMNSAEGVGAKLSVFSEYPFFYGAAIYEESGNNVLTELIQRGHALGIHTHYSQTGIFSHGPENLCPDEMFPEVNTDNYIEHFEYAISNALGSQNIYSEIKSGYLAPITLYDKLSAKGIKASYAEFPSFPEVANPDYCYTIGYRSIPRTCPSLENQEESYLIIPTTEPACYLSTIYVRNPSLEVCGSPEYSAPSDCGKWHQEDFDLISSAVEHAINSDREGITTIGMTFHLHNFSAESSINNCGLRNMTPNYDELQMFDTWLKEKIKPLHDSGKLDYANANDLIYMAE